MPTPNPVPPELATRPFRTADARASGVPAWQLRGKRYSSPCYGVHLARELEGLADRCAAAMVALREPVVFSHHTAASLLGLPLLGRDDRLHVTVLPGRAGPRHRAMVGHVCAIVPAEICTVAGLPVTSAARTYADLAACLARPALGALGDAIVRHQLATIAELAYTLEARPGRRGSRCALDLLPRLNPAAESPMESVNRFILTDGGLPEPEVNCNIYDVFGSFVARVDLLYRAAKVVVEYDGDQHRVDRDQWVRDVRRLSELAANGYLVLRFTASDVLGRPAWVVATVRAALAAAR
jgi:Protein of unknown function (DUF559)